MFHVSTVADIDQWQADAWPNLPDARFYSSPAWLRCAKASTGGEVGAILVHDDDDVVAVVPFWLTTGRENSARTPARLLAPVGVRGQRFLVAGTSTAYLSEFLAVNDETRFATADLVVGRIRELADAYSVDGAIALYADDRATSAYLAATPGRVAVLVDAEGVLPVPDMFETFPVGVSSHRRRRIHRELRSFNEAAATSPSNASPTAPTSSYR